MNSPTPTTPIVFKPSRTTRAHLSPLRRYARHAPLAHHFGAAASALAAPASSARTGISFRDSILAPSDRWWTPNVIDRLRPPLTRYRD